MKRRGFFWGLVLVVSLGSWGLVFWLILYLINK